MGRAQNHIQTTIGCVDCKALIIFPCHSCWPWLCMWNNPAVSYQPQDTVLETQLYLRQVCNEKHLLRKPLPMPALSGRVLEGNPATMMLAVPAAAPFFLLLGNNTSVTPDHCRMSLNAHSLLHQDFRCHISHTSHCLVFIDVSHIKTIERLMM